MAKNSSFDVTTGVDLQEVDNAVNQAMSEVSTRYDFKGTNCTIEFDRAAATLKLDADDELKLKALFDVLQARMVRRKVPVKNLDLGAVDVGSMGRVRQEIGLKQGIPQDTAKQIVKDIKDLKLKKVQASIQGDQLRVQAPKRDDLQEVISFLKGEDYGVELQFGNYR